MTSPTATFVAAPVEGTPRYSRRSTDSCAVAMPDRARPRSPFGACRRRVVSFCVSLLASTCVALPVAAEPAAHSTTARMGVSVNVVSTCAIDSRAPARGLDTYTALDVRCGIHDHPVTSSSPAQTLGTGRTARSFVVATVNF